MWEGWLVAYPPRVEREEGAAMAKRSAPLVTWGVDDLQSLAVALFALSDLLGSLGESYAETPEFTEARERFGEVSAVFSHAAMSIGSKVPGLLQGAGKREEGD